MKLVSLNIGIKINNTKEVINFLKSNSFDIIGLQESIRPLDAGAFEQYRSATEIEESLKETTPFKYFSPLWIADKFMKNGIAYRDFGGWIEQGNHLISKFPITSAQTLFYQFNYGIWTDTTRFREIDGPRNILVSTLDLNGKLLKIINIHGTWNQTRLGDERTITNANLSSSMP